MALRNPARSISRFLFGNAYGRYGIENSISKDVKAKIKDSNLRSLYEQIEQAQLEAMNEMRTTQNVVYLKDTNADTVARTYFFNIFFGYMVYHFSGRIADQILKAESPDSLQPEIKES